MKKSVKTDLFRFNLTQEKMIPGLYHFKDILTDEYMEYLLKEINLQPWNTELKRRTQHYGYKYVYQQGIKESSYHADAIPEFLMNFANDLKDNGLIDRIPDQIIINEYTPGQGISPHIDDTKLFGPEIYSFSLGSTAIMTFKRLDQKIDIVLEPGDFIKMTGDARYLWTHSIAPRKSDIIDGKKKMRNTRVSITFRFLK